MSYTSLIPVGTADVDTPTVASGRYHIFLNSAASDNAYKKDNAGVITPLVASLVDPMSTIGDIIIRNGANVTDRLGIGTAGFALTSNGAGLAPSWQAITATPAGANNDVQFNNAGVLGAVTTAANGVLITSAGSVPSISSTLPAAVQGNITAVGTIASGTWNGNALGVAYGGTNIASYTIGDLIQASAATTLASLAAVATGNVLLSGGVATISAWGKVGLTTHVSGVLPTANGGTNVNIASAALVLGTPGGAGVDGKLTFSNATNAFTQTFTGSALAASRNFILPTADPTAGQVLSASAPTGADITLSWATASSGITQGTTTVASGTAGDVLINLGAGIVSSATVATARGYHADQGTPFGTFFGFECANSGSFSSPYDTYIGYQAGKAMTTGGTYGSNTYIGYQAGYQATTTYGNVAIGKSALATAVTGPLHTTAVGDRAATSMTSGDYNVIIGTTAAISVTSATNCTFVGAAAMVSGTSGLSNSIALGFGSQCTANNEIVIGADGSLGGGQINSMYVGNGKTATTPNNVTFYVTNGTGTDKTGGSVIWQTGLGTGAGTPSSFTIKTPTTLATGTTATTAVSRLIISGGAVTTDISTATWAEALNFVFGTTTGSSLGSATNQKISVYGVTPVIQSSGAAQVAPAAYSTGAFGLDSNANMQALYDLVVAMRTALVDFGIMKGSA